MKFPQGMDIERKSVKIGSSEPGNERPGKLAITIRSQNQNRNEIPARVGHDEEIF